MLTQAVFFLLLISGGVFCATFTSKKIEDILPLQFMVMMAVLYTFGLFGHLSWGIYFLHIAMILLYGVSIAANIKTNKWKSTCANLFTPAFAILCAMFLVLNICDYGELAHTWDEFSHWMDSVKAMTYLDDFITNPHSESFFKSYPPAMSLLQYFFQKTYLALMVYPGEAYRVEFHQINSSSSDGLGMYFLQRPVVR